MAGPASAATGSISGPSTAFVAQLVSFQVSGAPSLIGGTVTGTLMNGSTQVGTPVVVVGGQASLTLTTPRNPQQMSISVWFSAADGSSLGQTSAIALQVSGVPTTTAISAPNTAQIGVPTLITINVQSQSPSGYAPTGQVVVRDINGAVITTMGLTPSWTSVQGQSFAYWRWAPPSAGTFTFQASYAGDGIAGASTSPVDVIIGTPSGNTISLAAPGTMTVGVPVLLTGTVVPANTQGSAGFTLNGAPISASVPFVNGSATFLWTPTVAGPATLGVNYMTNNGRSGSTSDQVKIVSGPAAVDVITLVQPGFGPWAPNGIYTRGNGTTFTFQASTLSGAPVTLVNTGPCNNTGLTLTIDTGTGQCNLVAKTTGGPGYAPVQQGYTVLMVPGQQQATLAAPPSGRFPVGRTIRLQNPTEGVTSANQNVHWRITAGSNRCRLRFPSNGAVNVELQRAGECTVVAQAPAVPNAWQAFRLQRAYTAR